MGSGVAVLLWVVVGDGVSVAVRVYVTVGMGVGVNDGTTVAVGETVAVGRRVRVGLLPHSDVTMRAQAVTEPLLEPALVT